MVTGWTISDSGELVDTELRETNDPEIFVWGVYTIFGGIPDFYLLNRSFFMDRLAALKRAHEVACIHYKTTGDNILALYTEIKELEDAARG